ncbi:hypothetical protein KR018_001739 [Drosophila ironensis]|nr:hypothetical protein KR018_001739 [Drosophila ironensis]
MFSIFGKRKPAETPPEEPIQGPVEEPRPGTSVGDDFVFVDRKSGPGANPISGFPPGPGSMYPPMPSAGYGGLPYPPMPGPKPGPTPAQAPAPVNYLQDIPFELAPGLAGKEAHGQTQVLVDSILALLTRQMSLDELAEEYTFALERSVQNDC